MKDQKTLWILLAIGAGFLLAVWAIRHGFRLRPRRGAVTGGTPVPPSAQPRWLAPFGEFYDPYGMWPYGNNSTYAAWVVPSNSGVPTTSVASPGGRSPATGPLNPLVGGNFTGGGQGRGR